MECSAWWNSDTTDAPLLRTVAGLSLWAMSSSSSSSDVAFTPAVKKLQTERGSREAYARGGFRTEIDDRLRGFLEEVDTAFLATASAEGQPYVQHRGGPRGFIRALDDRTLGFVELSGNRQYVSEGNLSENERVALILMDYAHRRRVKIWGRARVVAATPELLSQFPTPPPKARPVQVMLVGVTAWDANCPQHIPMKLDAEDVAAAVARMQARIEELEEENRKLRAP